MTGLKLPADVPVEVEDLARTYVLVADEQVRDLTGAGSPAYERLLDHRVRIIRRLDDLGYSLELVASRYVLTSYADMLDLADVA